MQRKSYSWIGRTGCILNRSVIIVLPTVRKKGGSLALATQISASSRDLYILNDKLGLCLHVNSRGDILGNVPVAPNWIAPKHVYKEDHKKGHKAKASSHMQEPSI